MGLRCYAYTDISQLYDNIPEGTMVVISKVPYWQIWRRIVGQ